MKKHISQIFSVVFLALALTAGSKRAAAQDIQVSFQMFYDNLSPYGQWVYDPDFGNVWVPNEGGDFRPYGSRGQWVMTEYGNTWVSEDPWGWAVYHYGRWTYNPYYGWIWVPGYEWAPAWVSWRYGGGYAGWAPLAPGINVGVTYYAPDSWWIFMGPQYMYQPNCMRYWYGPSYNRNYMYHTTVINNYYIDNTTRVRYNYGPRAEVIQQTTGHPVRVYQVTHRNRPGAASVGRNSVSIYRPTVNQGTVRDARPARVVQAPRSIGRGVQQVQPGNGQPTFRQELPRLQQQEGGRGRMDDDRGGRLQQEDRSQRGRFDNQPTRQPQQEQQDRPQRGGFDNQPTQQPQQPDRPQRGRFDNQPAQQPQDRPQRGRFDDQPAQQPQQPQDRPQRGRFDNQPAQQPQQPQDRPQRGRFDNQPAQQPLQPQDRPQPGRGEDRQPQRQPQQRQFDQRPSPRPEAPQRQPQPQQREPQQGGRPQGGGRR
ncbi:MAG: hypothetical protein KF744_06985 [Taibaiella sp.]|nr:hypothetical protein [Taibaiella sp.]